MPFRRPNQSRLPKVHRKNPQETNGDADKLFEIVPRVSPLVADLAFQIVLLLEKGDLLQQLGCLFPRCTMRQNICCLQWRVRTIKRRRNPQRPALSSPSVHGSPTIQGEEAAGPRFTLSQPHKRQPLNFGHDDGCRRCQHYVELF